ncbi:MAG TPA: asparaginase, partial [Candidatus Cloacimonadota bacterium]|nr:asparaginase [Candidatus Cloacimonadota bacterium]
DPDNIVYHRSTLYRENVWTDALDTRVDLIKAVAGMDAKYINCSVESGARAIVIEAFGRGNLPKDLLPDLRRAIDSGVLVVIASRTYTGRVLPEYGYEGGGKNLEDMGAILAGDLKGIKVRLKLMTLFGKYKDADTVRRFFLQSQD